MWRQSADTCTEAATGSSSHPGALNTKAILKTRSRRVFFAESSRDLRRHNRQLHATTTQESEPVRAVLLFQIETLHHRQCKLLFSDIPRSGIGFYSLATTSSMVEPDSLQYYGPWAYSVQLIHKNETTTSSPPSASLWSYKFDTTSVSWRAFAVFLKVDEFPNCVLYKSACPSAMLSKATVFRMIDALSSAVARSSRSSRHHQQSSRPMVAALVTKSNYFDRLHEYVLPQLFVMPTFRANQAFYYPPHMLEQADYRMCFPLSKDFAPQFCSNHWTNFERSCPEDDRACRSVGTIEKHVIQRMQTLQTQFPGAVVDLTILESAEPMRQIRGGVCYAGRRGMDVSTVLRVRECSAIPILQDGKESESMDPCETILVHDYR